MNPRSILSFLHALKSAVSASALFAACLIAAPPVSGQEAAQTERHLIGYTSEYNARSWATKKVLPTYPVEAIEQGIAGLVEVGIGRNDRGEVIKVRISPQVHPLLRKAAVDAARQWHFKPYVMYQDRPGEYHINRLTFNFIIEEGKGRVELFKPVLGSYEDKRMGGASGRDRTEWLRWQDATNDN
jgi:TonB family protein